MEFNIYNGEDKFQRIERYYEARHEQSPLRGTTSFQFLKKGDMADSDSHFVAPETGVYSYIGEVTNPSDIQFDTNNKRITINNIIDEIQMLKDEIEQLKMLLLEN